MTRVDAQWLAALRARADVPPPRPRVPLLWGNVRIGSVESGVMQSLALPSSVASEAPSSQGMAWRVQGDDLTRSLHAIALAMRERGVAHVWRDEQLAVTDVHGSVLATVERAVVRPLGIATRAVHLAGLAPDGRHWVQQRALDKANDPGLWDTLMGGMVPASDSTEQALERETWEEAGLKLTQIRDLRHAGHFTMRRPTGPGASGYVLERLDWYTCVVPDGVVPSNQDGEVEQFQLLDAQSLAGKLLAEEFTLEAALILAQLLQSSA